MEKQYSSVYRPSLTRKAFYNGIAYFDYQNTVTLIILHNTIGLYNKTHSCISQKHDFLKYLYPFHAVHAHSSVYSTTKSIHVILIVLFWSYHWFCSLTMREYLYAYCPWCVCARDFKALMFAYKTSSAPLYLNSVLQTYVPSRSLNSASQRHIIGPSQSGTKHFHGLSLAVSHLVEWSAQLNPRSWILKPSSRNG